MMLARVTITASDTTHVTEIETTSAVLAVGNVVPTWVTGLENSTARTVTFHSRLPPQLSCPRLYAVRSCDLRP